MNVRHALLAVLLATSALLALFSLTPRNHPVHADEPAARPTPTPSQPSRQRAAAESVEGIEVDLPDLVISNIRVIPSPPLVNRPVTIEVTVQNIGTAPVADTNNFFVDLYINPPAPPRPCTVGTYFWPVQGFQVGAGSYTMQVTLDPETDPRAAAFRNVGVVTLWAQADSQCNVIESRETNNLRATAVTVRTRSNWSQTTHEDFQEGFSSSLDLTHPLGILQNGTGWFDQPRFPPPEEQEWGGDPASNFYNPDRHIYANNLPDTYPRDQLATWNPPDQVNVDIAIGAEPETLFAVWEDARHGERFDRDIYFSHSLNSGATWSEPVRVNQDPLRNGHNQLRPKLVVDREAPQPRLFVFWEDNRLGNYDIFFARALDPLGARWEEPASNPVNDKNVDPNADQINVSAAGFYNEESGQTELFVAWEDYRNGNGDIFFEWSRNGGTTWLKTPDNNRWTVDANIHVQPDPASRAAAYHQRKPHLFLDRSRSYGTIDYCAATGRRDTTTLLPPRVFIVWEDERDIANGDPSNIYYTRGEFDPRTYIDPETQSGCPWQFQPELLPAYRFEDDHVRVNSDNGSALQLSPAGSFSSLGEGFLSDIQYEAIYTATAPITGTPVVTSTFTFNCENRYLTEEIVISWEDDRDGTSNIWAANIFESLRRVPVYGLVATNEITTTVQYAPAYQPGIDPPPPTFDRQTARETGCRQSEPLPRTPPSVPRNANQFSPQPAGFLELSLPEGDLKVGDEMAHTFEPKPMCQAPQEPPAYQPIRPEQRNPRMVMLPSQTPVDYDKPYADAVRPVTAVWNVWEDNRAHDIANRDIFLRPVIRMDASRTLTVENEDGTIISSQVVQNNVKNQVMLRQWNLFEEYLPASVEQSNPAITFHSFDGDYTLYVAWDDNRNANPLIGFAGNRDVFAARMRLDPEEDYVWEQGEEEWEQEPVWRPTRTATFISSVFGNNIQEATWYDIEWWGDISADGVLSVQTRFGFDPNNPEPPLENVAANGWSQWTGVGGTAGFYTAPGQQITGPDGELLPRSYYIQYRVNFNPGFQNGIICLSEIRLNYEVEEFISLFPLIFKQR